MADKIQSPGFSTPMDIPPPSTIESGIDAKVKAAIIDATQPINYNSQMRSMRNSSTAYKKYAIKYFNTKIKERRERLLNKLGNNDPSSKKGA